MSGEPSLAQTGSDPMQVSQFLALITQPKALRFWCPIPVLLHQQVLLKDVDGPFDSSNLNEAAGAVIFESAQRRR